MRTNVFVRKFPHNEALKPTVAFQDAEGKVRFSLRPFLKNYTGYSEHTIKHWCEKLSSSTQSWYFMPDPLNPEKAVYACGGSLLDPVVTEDVIYSISISSTYRYWKHLRKYFLEIAYPEYVKVFCPDMKIRPWYISNLLSPRPVNIEDKTVFWLADSQKPIATRILGKELWFSLRDLRSADQAFVETGYERYRLNAGIHEANGDRLDYEGDSYITEKCLLRALLFTAEFHDGTSPSRLTFANVFSQAMKMLHPDAAERVTMVLDLMEETMIQKQTGAGKLVTRISKLFNPELIDDNIICEDAYIDAPSEVGHDIPKRYKAFEGKPRKLRMINPEPAIDKILKNKD